MEKITIAFDCDGTLIENRDDGLINPNTRIVELLKILSSFKNVKIIVWSWRGKYWAESVVNSLMLRKYVYDVASKNHKWKDGEWKHIFEPDIFPNICIDDIQACELWMLNLIVKEK